MMQEEDLKSIIITIAGRPFPVKVDEKEMVLAKEIEKEINTTIVQFQNSYPTKDKLDCVIMTLLKYTFDLKKLPDGNDQETVLNKISAIRELLNQPDFD